MSADLQAQLAAREADIVALREELEETNKGVVALYAELDDKAAELREATELKSRFLSYMSHEFRTPLTSMSSITGILLSRLDGPLTAEQQKQVEFIRSFGARAHRHGRRPARPRQGRSRPHHHLAGVVRDGGPVLGAARHVQAHRREHFDLAGVR